MTVVDKTTIISIAQKTELLRTLAKDDAGKVFSGASEDAAPYGFCPYFSGAPLVINALIIIPAPAAAPTNIAIGRYPASPITAPIIGIMTVSVSDITIEHTLIIVALAFTNHCEIIICAIALPPHVIPKPLKSAAI
jgi:hypothetical protein